jgi:Cu(I)/Ag(I) efflux system membrane protein CusA/SilA
MKLFGVEANIVALSGIAIAIGTIVDMGIVICENILRHLQTAEAGQSKLETVYKASSEVGSAILTAVATTVVGFLPVFTMSGAEGKLFRPLAFTKTFALAASIVIALTILPPAALVFLKKQKRRGFKVHKRFIPVPILNIIVISVVVLILGKHWMPLGYGKAVSLNILLIVLVIGVVLLLFYLFQKFYQKILNWCLEHKAAFLSVPTILVIFGGFTWAGLGKEFMPPLDEGSFLYMPTTMPHASIGEALDILQKQDIAFQRLIYFKTIPLWPLQSVAMIGTDTIADFFDCEDFR